MNDTAIHTTLHIFSDDIQSILGSFSAVDHKRKLLFSGNVKLGTKHFLLDLMFLFFLMPVIVQPDLTDCHHLVHMG